MRTDQVAWRAQVDRICRCTMAGAVNIRICRREVRPARDGWVTRNDFRTFIHPPEGMVRAAEAGA
jgi:hypothetical protein